VALKRFDCKEIVAYSTLRQIGLIMLILSLNFKNARFFHLFTHALFKSVLFIRVGYLIHIFNTQDVRLINLNFRPFSLKTPLFVRIISIRGLPFFRGFYSKDIIIDRLFFSYNRYFLGGIVFIIVMLTSLYRFRLIYLVLCSKLNSGRSWMWDDMVVSINFLILSSVFVGRGYQWLSSLEQNLHNSELKVWILLILLRRRVIRFKILYFKFYIYNYLYSFNFVTNIFISIYSNSFFMFDQGWLKKSFFF